MAIDTAAERVCAMASSEPWCPNVLPIPDASVGNSDRWTLQGMYFYENFLISNNWDYSTENALTLQVKTSASGLQVEQSVETLDVKVDI